METARAQTLTRMNLAAGVLHLVQFAAVAALSNDFGLPVVASYMAGPPGAAFTDPIELWSTPVGWSVALFFLMSAVAHFAVISPWRRADYLAGLDQGHNYYRWLEYSASSSVMIVLIAQVCGVRDVGAIIALVGVNASMILFGWVQEKYVRPGTGDLLPFWFGCIAGIVPWIVIGFNVIAPKNPLDVSPPGFVYGIVVTIFLMFNSFAWVQYKQYQAKGKWSDYLRGERAYIVLSLVAKSLLAWQIFANTLIPQ